MLPTSTKARVYIGITFLGGLLSLSLGLLHGEWTEPSRYICYLALALLASGMKVSRSEEHTSELQSQSNLVCRLLLEKKKKIETLHRSVPKKQNTTHPHTKPYCSLIASSRCHIHTRHAHVRPGRSHSKTRPQQSHTRY